MITEATLLSFFSTKTTIKLKLALKAYLELCFCPRRKDSFSLTLSSMKTNPHIGITISKKCSCIIHLQWHTTAYWQIMKYAQNDHRQALSITMLGQPQMTFLLADYETHTHTHTHTHRPSGWMVKTQTSLTEADRRSCETLVVLCPRVGFQEQVYHFLHGQIGNQLLLCQGCPSHWVKVADSLMKMTSWI